MPHLRILPAASPPGNPIELRMSNQQDPFIEGYSTVAEWWTRCEAEALELLDDPASTFLAEEVLLTRLSDKVHALYYDAHDGAVSRRLFQNSLLAEFYSVLS